MTKTLSIIIAFAVAASALNATANARIIQKGSTVEVLCERGYKKGQKSYYSTLELAKKHAARDCGAGNYGIDFTDKALTSKKAKKQTSSVGFVRPR